MEEPTASTERDGLRRGLHVEDTQDGFVKCDDAVIGKVDGGTVFGPIAPVSPSLRNEVTGAD